VQVIDLNDKVNLKVFALVYGASGTGKTHLMGTVGALGRTLIIDIDQGIKTLKYAPDLQSSGVLDNITVVSFDHFKDLNEAYKLIEANDPKLWSQKFGAEITQPFEWIIWDTWSAIQWYMLQEVRKNSDRLGGGKLDFRKNIEIQHWGMLTDLNKLSIESFRDCKVNQIFTMQETLSRDELSGTVYGGPAIHGKMVQEMPAYFDVVVRTYTDISGNYCATTRSKGRWPAKTRFGVGEDYKNPTAKQIFCR
jgi:hypothetical protein